MTAATTTTRPPTRTTIKSLGRHSLSIILSYLVETDGTSFMLCRKIWTRNLLPIFRVQEKMMLPTMVPQNQDNNNNDDGDGDDDNNNDDSSNNKSSNNNSNVLSVMTTVETKVNDTTTTTRGSCCTGRIRIKQNRHRFDVVIPIPDSTVRLDRLNTRRYRRKLRLLAAPPRMGNTCKGHSNNNCNYNKNMTTQQLAQQEWMETTIRKNNNNNINTSEEEGPFTSSSSRGGGPVIINVPFLPLRPPLLQFHRPNLRLSSSSSTSSDNRQQQTQQQQQQQPLFLHGTTVLASYPRSGNTMLRTMLESVTGFVTGSDTRPDRPLSIALADNHELVGEGVVSASITPICKTHWPERVGWDHTMTGQRVVLLVRNPFDAIDSYWHMNVTNTHTEKVTDDVYDGHTPFYQSLVRNEMSVWMKFLDYYDTRSTLSMMDRNTLNDNVGNTLPATTTSSSSSSSKLSSSSSQQQRSHHNKVPVLWVRYEDLIHNPRAELERILQFCTTEDWWRRRLEELFPPTNETSNSNDYDEVNNKKKEEEEEQQHHLPDEQQLFSGYHDPSSSSIQQQQQHHHHPSTESSSTESRRRQDGGGVGSSLRKQRFPPDLLLELHEMDDNSNGWLSRLGYHVYDQGFPNNVRRLPPLPSTTTTTTPTPTPAGSSCSSSNSSSSSSIPINRPLSHELRPTDSPFGRNMREWRRERTYDDTKPFPTTTMTRATLNN